MTEAEETELAFWQSRCEDMQVALEIVREQRDELQKENAISGELEPKLIKALEDFLITKKY
jgi:hypothetical protein